MVMVVKPLQPENALLPIEVTLLGMTTEAKMLHPSKALLPMEVTSLGISMEVKPVHL